MDMENSTIYDEVKLKDALLEKLENNGYITELKAQLSSRIYNTLQADLEWTTNNTAASPSNDGSDELPKTTATLCLEPYLQSDEGTLALYLVKDMLDCLGLYYTSMIFKTEIGGENSLYRRRSQNQLIDMLHSMDLENTDLFNSRNGSCTEESNDIDSTATSTTTMTNYCSYSKKNSLNIKSRPLLVEILHKTLRGQSIAIKNALLANETYIKSPITVTNQVPSQNDYNATLIKSLNDISIDTAEKQLNNISHNDVIHDS